MAAMNVFSMILVMLLMFLLGALPAILIGVFVYRDAKARGMDVWLWTLVAVLAPSFIGLIVYLVVRSSHNPVLCPQCGRTVRDTYAACPYCSQELKTRCPSCGTLVEGDWKVCAQCGAALPEGRPAPIRAGAGGNGKAIWILLICLIAVPIVLALLAAGLFAFRTMGTDILPGMVGLLR